MHYYPVETIAAMVNSVMGISEKVAHYIKFAESLGIQVLPPDINESYSKFTVKDNSIRFGMAAIKNVGVNVVDGIVEARKKLAGEGILMPLVRIRDDEGLASREFAILSYRQTLRKESVETEIEDASYIVECLEKTVRENYAHILNRDLVKDMVENLQKKYPALIRGVVPERISYGYLTDVFKQLLKRGLAPWYFSKIIEIMDSECRRNPSITEEELVCTIGKKVQEK